MIDYRPDLSPLTPGILTSVTEAIPTAKGYRSAFAEVAHVLNPSFPSLASGETYPTSLFAFRMLISGSSAGEVYGATNKRIFKVANPYVDLTITNPFSIGSATYSVGEDAPTSVDMCAYGNQIFACNKNIVTRVRTAGSGSEFQISWATTAPPQANTCCAAKNFVFLGDCGNWSTVTGATDILAWCALGNYLDWAPNPQVTQASWVQFTDTVGAITAVRPFRDGILVFKAESMYIGRYVGTGTDSPIWEFERISDKIGCLGPRSCANIDTQFVFVGKDDIYRFDGNYPVSITDGIYETIKPVLTANGNQAMLVGHDKPNSSCWFVDNVNLVTYVWNYKYNRWGKMTNSGVTIPCQTQADDFRVKTLSTVTAGVPSYTTSTEHYNLYTLTSVTGTLKNRNSTRSSSFSVTFSLIGQPNEMSTLDTLTPLLSIAPSTASNLTLSLYGGKSPASLSSLGSKTMNTDYRMNNLGISGVNNNFIRPTLTSTEDCEVMGILSDLKPSGKR